MSARSKGMGYCSTLGCDPEMGSRQVGAGCVRMARWLRAAARSTEQQRARQLSSARDTALGRARQGSLAPRSRHQVCVATWLGLGPSWSLVET